MQTIASWYRVRVALMKAEVVAAKGTLKTPKIS